MLGLELVVSAAAAVVAIRHARRLWAGLDRVEASLERVRANRLLREVA